jgi:hypothetical protein
VDRPFWMADMERREEKEKKPVVGRQQARRHAIGSGSTPSSPPPPPPTAAAGTCCVALRAVPLALLSLWHGISLPSPQPGECSEQKQTVSQCTGPAGGRTDGRSFSVLVPKMPLIPFSSKDQNFPGPGLHRPPSYAGVVVLACVLVIGVNAREPTGSCGLGLDAEHSNA